jgi:phage shock protein A
MLGFFARLRRVFQAEAHTALSRFEDPIKMTEQGVRDLKSNLAEATINLAQVKSVAIRMRREAEAEKRRATEYEGKAVALLGRGQTGELALPEADRLASEALRLKTASRERHAALDGNAGQQEQLAAHLQNRIEGLRREINRYENELITLRARAKTARSVRKINQHLSGAEGSDTVAMLGRMRDKVAQEEALAEAYGHLNTPAADVEGEIDRALQQDLRKEVADSLAELKARMGIALEPPKR